MNDEFFSISRYPRKHLQVWDIGCQWQIAIDAPGHQRQGQMTTPLDSKHPAQAMIKRDYRASYSQVKVIGQPGEITRLPFASIS